MTHVARSELSGVSFFLPSFGLKGSSLRHQVGSEDLDLLSSPAGLKLKLSITKTKDLRFHTTQ